MKVLVAGGEHSQNIINSIRKKFESGGIDFVTVKYIDEIKDIYSRGEYFDRAVIIEQSWTQDGRDGNESSWRIKLSDFAEDCSKRIRPGMSFVFLTPENNSASIVYEETFKIQGNSIVVVKKGPYNISFFASLVRCDFAQFPDSLVYKPESYDVDTAEPAEEVPAEPAEPQYDNTENWEVDMSGGDSYEVDLGSEGGYGQFDVPDFSSEQIDETSDLESGDYTSDGYDQLDGDEGYGQLGGEGYDQLGDEGYDQVGGGYDTEVPLEDYEQPSDDCGYNGEEFTEPSYEPEGYDIPAEEPYDQDYGPIPGEPEYGPKYDEDYGDPYEKEDEEYKGNEEVERVNMSDAQMKAALQAFASRGNSIVVTGCGGCGTSTIAFNLANTLCNLGYSVLLVDMDTKGRTQSYISKDNYDSMDTDGANLMAAVNSSTGIDAHVAVVRNGFHLLSMGIGGDIAPADKLLHKQKLLRFTSSAKNGHEFIIYDIPFDTASDFAAEVIHMCDNLVLVVDASNWGVTKTMMQMCNIDSDDLQQAFFSRAQIVFNRYRGVNKFFGKKVKNMRAVTRAMDDKVVELIGEEPEYYFKDMYIAGVVKDNTEFESGWYARKQFSDTKAGQPIFIELVKNILLRVKTNF